MALDFSGGLLGQVSGALGITDPNKGTRAFKAVQSGQSDATRTLDADTTPQMGMLSDAMIGRSLGQNLDTYDESMAGATDTNRQALDLTSQQSNAGTSGNVQKYLNPKMDMMLGNTMQRMQGSAGAGLQSSATNTAIAKAVSQQAGDLWERAYQDAIGNANLNLSVANSMQGNAGQTAQFAGMQLGASNAPAEDYLQLGNDKAMQKYAGNIALTQAGGQLAGADRSLIGGIIGG